MTRVITIGTGIASCRAALAIAAENDGVYAALGIDPHQAGRRRRRSASTSCASCSTVPRRSRSARPASTTTTAPRRKNEQRRLFEAQLELARELGLPVVIHTREANDDTAAILGGHDGHRGHALLLRAGAARRRARARLVLLLRRQRHLPEAQPSCARQRRAFPPTGSSPRRTAPTCRRSRSGGGRTSRPTSSTPSPRSPPRAARTPTSSRRGSTRTRPRRSRCRDSVTVIPKKRLGQHFLVGREHPRRDRPPRRARPRGRRARDRPRPRRPHAATSRTACATSTPSSSTARSRRTSGSSRSARNVDLHWGDALALDLASLEPAPTKLVANLPYNIATPVVAESLTGLPALELWCVMVQREVADRFFAEPVDEGVRRRLGAGAARHAGARASTRSPARSSGRRRTSTPRSSRSGALRCPTRFERVKAVVEASFAHRRKTLPNSLALAGLADRERSGGSARGDRAAPGDPGRGARAGGVRGARRGAPGAL